MARTHTVFNLSAFPLFNPSLWRVVGVLLLYVAAGLAVPVGVSVYSGDGMQFALAASCLAMLMAGLFLKNIVGRRR